MKKITIVLISLNLFLLASCCGTKSLVVLVPDPDGNVGQVTVSNDGGQQVLKEANQSVKVMDRNTPPGEVKKLSADEIRSQFTDALAAQPIPPETFILYFLQDSNELTSESNALLPQIFQAIQRRNATDIVISGHTDKVGSKEYNYKLSLDRAKVLYGILVKNGAVPADITVTSHGEGNPLIQTADEVAEPKNRRVEVVIK